MEENQLLILNKFWQKLTDSPLPPLTFERDAFLGDTAVFTVQVPAPFNIFYDEATLRADLSIDGETSKVHIRGWFRHGRGGASIHHCDWQSNDGGESWERA